MADSPKALSLPVLSRDGVSVFRHSVFGYESVGLAVISVVSDISCIICSISSGLSKGKASFVTTFELSKAFDTAAFNTS